MQNRKHWIYSYLNIDVLNGGTNKDSVGNNDNKNDNDNGNRGNHNDEEENLKELNKNKENNDYKEKARHQSLPNKFVKKFIKTLSVSLMPKNSLNSIQSKNDDKITNTKNKERNTLNYSSTDNENNQEENIIENILVSQSEKVSIFYYNYINVILL